MQQNELLSHVIKLSLIQKPSKIKRKGCKGTKR